MNTRTRVPGALRVSRYNPLIIFFVVVSLLYLWDTHPFQHDKLRGTT